MLHVTLHAGGPARRCHAALIPAFAAPLAGALVDVDRTAALQDRLGARLLILVAGMDRQHAAAAAYGLGVHRHLGIVLVEAEQPAEESGDSAFFVRRALRGQTGRLGLRLRLNHDLVGAESGANQFAACALGLL
jgi:hypothetical protein